MPYKERTVAAVKLIKRIQPLSCVILPLHMTNSRFKMIYLSKKRSKNRCLLSITGRDPNGWHVRFKERGPIKTKNPPGGGSFRIKIQTKINIRMLRYQKQCLSISVSKQSPWEYYKPRCSFLCSPPASYTGVHS